MESGKAKRARATSESGIQAMCKVGEFIFGKTGTNTKESGSIHSSTGTELIFLQTEIHSRVCTARVSRTVKALINGETAQRIQGSLKTGSNMEKENGGRIKDRTATTTLAHSLQI